MENIEEFEQVTIGTSGGRLPGATAALNPKPEASPSQSKAPSMTGTLPPQKAKQQGAGMQRVLEDLAGFARGHRIRAYGMFHRRYGMKGFSILEAMGVGVLRLAKGSMGM